jgi:hypothetical protein
LRTNQLNASPNSYKLIGKAFYKVVREIGLTVPGWWNSGFSTTEHTSNNFACLFWKEAFFASEFWNR